jgi:hypothetical protein
VVFVVADYEEHESQSRRPFIWIASACERSHQNSDFYQLSVLRQRSERTKISFTQDERTAAPFLRSDVGDSLGEVPAMATKILSVVLTLTVRVALRLGQDDGSVLPRAFAVPVGILDSDLNDMRVVWPHRAFGDGEAAVSGFHLDAMIGDAQADGKAEGLRQPISCCARVRVNEHRDHRAGWY